MDSRKIRSILLALISGIIAMLILAGLMGTSTVQAQQQEEVLAQPPPLDDFYVTIVFTDPAVISITDLSGHIIGEGIHLGLVRCNPSSCSQRTIVSISSDSNIFLYKFKTRQAFDPVDERLVVEGTGRIISAGMDERFSFTATFQNNRDGTVKVRYEASNPDASFIIPNSPGKFTSLRR